MVVNSLGERVIIRGKSDSDHERHVVDLTIRLRALSGDEFTWLTFFREENRAQHLLHRDVDHRRHSSAVAFPSSEIFASQARQRLTHLRMLLQCHPANNRTASYGGK